MERIEGEMNNKIIYISEVEGKRLRGRPCKEWRNIVKEAPDQRSKHFKVTAVYGMLGPGRMLFTGG